MLRVVSLNERVWSSSLQRPTKNPNTQTGGNDHDGHLSEYAESAFFQCRRLREIQEHLRRRAPSSEDPPGIPASHILDPPRRSRLVQRGQLLDQQGSAS